MGNLIPRGIVVFSIDFGPRSREGVRPDHGSWNGLKRALLELMDRYGVPSTWAFSHPIDPNAMGYLLNSPGSHEIALLGHSSWMAAEVNRPTFAEELRRRLSATRDAGAKISSLVLQEVDISRHLDLLTKNNIIALRGCSARGRAEPTDQRPRMLRCGIWYEPTDVVIPLRRAWLSIGGRQMPAMRALRRAAGGGAVHVAVDANELLERGLSGLRDIEHVIQQTSVGRDQGHFRLRTLAESAACRRLKYKSTPARSILRPAA